MTTPNLFSFFESANERRSPVEPGVLPAYAPARAGTAAPADLLADLNEPQREAVLHAGSPVLVVAGYPQTARNTINELAGGSIRDWILEHNKRSGGNEAMRKQIEEWFPEIQV